MVRSFLSATLVFSSISFAAAVDAGALLKSSDRARGGLGKGITWEIEIESAENGTTNKRSFEVKARGDDALATATAPARNKGEIFLFNDRTMWFYKPGLRKPVGISARQKLTGEAANGDIASTQYSRDYEPRVLGEEKVGDEMAHKLELKAKNKNVTYDGVRYWIGSKTKLGLKAEFLSLDGKVLKQAEFTYGNQLTADGETFPFVSKMVIRDAKTPANHSTIVYKAPKATEIPPAIFNVNNLLR